MKISKSIYCSTLRSQLTRARLAIALPIVWLGCTQKQPFSAESNLRLTESVRNETLVLSEAEQSQALAAMVAVAEGHRVVNPPSAAIHGKRWSDVPAALKVACAELEMAIMRWQRSPRRSPTEYDCALRTIEGRPGRIVIRRTHDDRVYEAEATVGRFDDEPFARGGAHNKPPYCVGFAAQWQTLRR